MISRRLALSLGLGAAAVVAGSVAAGVQLRRVRAEAAHPPLGQFVTAGGLRVHYDMAGAGPDLILLHGASGNMRDFTFGLRDRLVPHFRVTTFDRPGLGYSDPLPHGGYSLADQGAVLRAAADQLGIARPIVLGQSFGGSVALDWGLQGGGLQGGGLQGGPAALVLLCAPSLPWPGGLDASYQVLSNPLGAAVLGSVASAFVPQAYVDNAVARIFRPEPVPKGYIAHIGTDLTLRRATLIANARQINGLRAQLVRMEPRYPGLALPVELIHGDADTIVPLAVHSARLVDMLPDARLTVIPGGGHMPQHLHAGLVVEATLRAATRAGLR